MLFTLLLVACLVDHDTYNRRKAELTDDDGDGFSDANGDCNDSDPSVGPNATEICDGIDNDCDFLIDSEDPDVSLEGFYEDLDGDGFGGQAATGSCDSARDWVQNDQDCDDGDHEVSPLSAEVCGDGLDNDCNNDPDECRYTDRNAGSANSRMVPAGLVDTFGNTFTALGDIDADGMADIAVGARGGSSDTVHIVYGADIQPVYDIDGSINTITWDADERVGFGATLGLAERTTVFGDPALLVGGNTETSWFSLPTIGPVGSDDADGVVSLTTSVAMQTVHFGFSTSADFDSDGLDDIVLNRIGNEGQSELIVVSADLWDGGPYLASEVESKRFESEGMVTPQISGTAGDLDGSGTPKLCLSAPFLSVEGSLTGAVFVIDVSTAPVRGDLRDHARVIAGESPGDAFGLGSCRSVGDLNSDGYDDLFVGALLGGSSGTAAGTVYVFFGPVDVATADDADIRVDGAIADDSFGVTLGRPGDFDGDGQLDLVVGAPQSLSGGPGAAFIYYGPVDRGVHSAGDAGAVLTGDRDGDGFGQAGFVGDLNSDGRSDLLVATTAADNAGAAYLFLGSGI